MEALGRTLLAAGGLLIAAGLLVLMAARFGLPLGRLPGDIAWRGRYGSVFMPLGTCLLLSVVVSLILWVVGHLRR
jgi:hypothetical protein